MAPKARDGRRVIIDSAISLFTAVGYHGTSIRDIAAKASVTVASIYYHFGSKQEILQEIMSQVLTDVNIETRRELERTGPDPAEQLEALVTRWILFHIERQDQAFIGASEIRSLDEYGTARIVALRDEQESLFREIIDAGVTAGRFTTPYPREAARAIINMGRAVSGWYSASGPISPEEMARQYAELSLALVRAEASTAATP